MAIANDHDRSAAAGVIFLGVIDAERAIERRSYVVGREAVVLRRRSVLVRFAEDLSAANATAAHQHEHAPRIMVAAAFRITAIDLWRATEFARDENRRRFEQPFFGHAAK